MKNILEAKRLNKVYEISKENSLQVLRDVEISIPQGEFVSVMGASGSGKSTLLYNISGMDRATSGSILLCDEEISTMGEDDLSALRLEKMGFVFQQSNLLANLNILDNIVYPGFAAKKVNRKDIVIAAKKLMSRMGISALADNDITQASGGQLQRVAICRALINDPIILFGDEPTGALNSKAANDVMDILTDINGNGTTIMLVTHDAKVAARTERVFFMADGIIKGECRLGKSNKEQNPKAREKHLSQWLEEMGL
ncbi:MAG: ABC transporter ATP-binding protein [Defluviitaleaceae bacterium]|nr:ABC transporter ATP-binding protein [Defluviitaleaceae bacterium]